MEASVRFMPSTHQKPTAPTHSCQSHHHPNHQYIRSAQNTLSIDVTVDPNILLPQDIRAKFTSLLDEYDHIFGYNGAEGLFEARAAWVLWNLPNERAGLSSIPSTNYWNSNKSLTSSKH